MREKHSIWENVGSSIPAFLALSATLLVGPVRAATVTNSADSGAGSLREAIANAVSGETIDFAISGPITLTSEELVIDKDLTVQGPGSGTLTIQRSSDAGTPDFRIFRVLTASVTLSGLTLSNGRADYGGGLLNEYSAVLLMRDITLSGNSATSAGGGLLNDGTLALEDSAFLGNSVQAIDGSGAFGGGLANWNAIDWLDRCLFQGNSASAGSGDGGGFGGAINNSGTILSMDGGVLQGNSADGGSGSGYTSGGAINNDYGTLTLTNCTLTGNSATGGAGGASSFGGGLNNDYGTVYVLACTVRGNVARGGTGTEGGLAEGGGVANGFGTLELTRSTVSGNLVVGGAGDNGGFGEGGGVANDYGTVYLSNSTVSGNVANGGAGTVSAGVPHGGGLFNGFASILVSHSTVAANVVSGGAPNDGGGIFNGGFVEIKNTIVAANHATVDAFNDEYAETFSYGFNCIGSTAGLFTAGLGDQFGVTGAALKLGPLQDNGGPTFTHALRCGSPALDAGDNTEAPATDQRGFLRIVHGVIDIGAYESANNVPTISCPSPITLNCAPPEGMVATVSVNVADADGDPLVVEWTVNGTAVQTNVVAAGGPPTDAAVGFTNLFAIGSHEVTVSVSDSGGCLASCSTTVEVRGFVPPTVANCPADATIECPATPEFGTPAFSDACDTNLTVTFADEALAVSGKEISKTKRTWTATDAQNNSTNCSQTITVLDTTAPTVASRPADATIECPAEPSFGAPTFSDTCDSTLTVTSVDANLPVSGKEISKTQRTWTATDDKGNFVTTSQTITVEDSAAPTVASSPADATIECPASLSFGTPTFSDTCDSTLTVTSVDENLSVSGKQVSRTKRTWTATDDSGNFVTTSQTITVEDSAAPTVASSPADATIECPALLSWGTPTFSDTCDSTLTVTSVDENLSVSGKQVSRTKRTWTATDDSGNFVTTSQTITVEDSAVPTVASSPADATIECPGSLSFGTPTFSDTCDSTLTVTSVDENLSVSGKQVSRTKRTWTATDDSGNFVTTSQTITVEDSAAPTVASSPADATIECPGSLSFGTPTFSDTCDSTLTVTSVDENLSVSGKQVSRTKRTWTATDDSGNFVTTSQTITVEDSAAPTVASSPADATIECPAEASFGTPTFSDTCDSTLTVTSVDENLSLSGKQLSRTKRTWTATDDNGNFVTTSQTITVEDSAAPTVANSPADATIECPASLSWGTPTFSDTCDSTLTVTSVDENLSVSGKQVSRTKRTWTATDDSGNVVTTSQTITVEDSAAPTVASSPADATIECPAALNFGTPTFSDTCDSTLTVTSADENLSVSGKQVSRTKRTWTATDDSGNVVTTSQTITVEDSAAPTVASSPADATIECPASLSFGTPTFSDTCDSTLTVTSVDENLSVSGKQVSRTKRTWTATDDKGNFVTTSQTISVEDNSAPTVASSPADATIQCPAEASFGTPTFSDTCDSTLTVTSVDENLSVSGKQLSRTKRTWTATDDSGNFVTTSQTITVEDSAAPTVASSPADATIQCPASLSFGTPTFSDTCDSTLTVTSADENLSVSGKQVSRTKRTWTATDDSGNFVTTSQTITVEDSAAPTVASSPADATIECPALLSFGTPTFSDTCDSTLTVTSVDENLSVSGKQLSRTKRTWTATDDSGNFVTTSQTITVEDSAAPTVASSPADATIECPALLSFGTPTFSDTCDSTLTVTSVDENLSVSGKQVSRTKRTWTATDDSGNFVTTSQTITVEDNSAPTVASSPTDATIQCPALLSFGTPTFSDTCDSTLTVTSVDENLSVSGKQLSRTKRTWTATDDSGNFVTTSQTITVEDSAAPTVASSPADATIECPALLSFGTPTFSDTCDSTLTVTSVDENLSVSGKQVSRTKRTWTATDDSGNFVTTSQTITVEDNSAPTVASSPTDATIQCPAEASFGTPTFSDTCDSTLTVTSVDENLSVSGKQLSRTKRTWTATDDNGNFLTTSQTITVEDSAAPTVASSPADATIECPASLSFGTPTFSDTCDSTLTVTSVDENLSLSGKQLSRTKRTWTATDDNGNFVTTSQTISVEDNSAPAVASSPTDATIQCPAEASFGTPTFSDTCDSTLTVTSVDENLSVSGKQLSRTKRTWTATDAHNNSTTCSQTITVTDTTAPVVTCPADSSTPADANCQAAVPNLLASASDNCTQTSAITLSQSPAADTLVGLGAHTITVTATDAAGNSATCSAIFTVTGNASLTVNCPAVPGASADANCQAVVPNILSGVTVSSGCGTPGTTSLSQSPAAGTLVGVGTNTITVTATDPAGHSASCTTTFTVTGSNAAISILTLTENSNNDTPTGPHIVTDSIVTWTYLVTNPSCESLTNITVTDSVAGVIPAYQAGDANLNGQLEPSETWTYAAYGIAGLGQYTNLGTATATGAVTGAPVTDSNPEYYFGDPTPCPAGLFTYSINAVTGDLEIKFYQFPAPNDNSYGVNAVGWEKGHSFPDLYNSDHAGFQLRNPSGAVVLEFWIDTISVKPGTPSGWGSLGPWGGDGKMIKGTLTTNDITFDTSIARNFNNLGYFVGGVQTAATKNGVNGADLLLNSPPTVDTLRDYTLKTPNPWTNGWDFKNSYFVTIKKAKLDSLGFNKDTWHVEPDLAGLHNSPAKPCPIGVVGAQFTAATGGDEISADGAVTNVFTTLTGPVYTEDVAGQVGLGTIVINASAGFVFDTGGTPPTVLVAKLSGSGNQTIQGSITSVTATQITYTVTKKSANQSSLTWQNIRVRPTSGAPLAAGYLSRSGTANVVGLPADSYLGTLQEIAGAARQLAMFVQPSETAMAGVPFDQQPAVLILDQFGNLRSSANGVDDHPVVTAVRLAGSGALQGSTSAAGSDGVVVFTNLSHNVATNITIQFTIPGGTPTVSDPIAVNSGAASRLVFTTQPGSTTYGSALGTQPVLKTQDEFGNATTAGLPASLPVIVSLSTGTGSLQGTTTLDIGTSAGNGVVSFSGLKVSAVGTGKQLTASVASGLTSAVSSSFDVAKATVTGSITANSKIYDGTTAASIATRSLSGVLGSDAVSLSGGTATFASKTVGNAKTVTATGLGLSGLDAANYQLASTTSSTTANITAKNLTVSGLTANNKVYDGNTTASLNTGSAALVGVVSGDATTLNSASASGTFASRTIGTAKTVTVSGLTISGVDAANYTLTQPGASADITAKGLTVSGITANNKVYDGTTTATLNLGSAALVGVATGDAVTLNSDSAAGAFATKTVGTAKSVTASGLSLSGADAANYTLAQPGTSANITAKGLTVSGITASNKVYDGTTTAALNLGSAALVGAVSGDAVTLNTASATGTFASKAVGTAKSVTVSGLTTSGADAANYTLSQPSTSADITQRALTVSATGVNKVYDGTTAASVTLSDNRVAGDTLTRSYTSASFDTRTVGTAKTVSVAGVAISGTDAGNYTANTTASTTANITAATVTGSITANNKAYDGTTAATIATRSLSGGLGSDDVSLSGGTATFASKTAGTAKTVTATGLSLNGADAANYQLASTTASATANITARALLVSAIGNNKVYDGSTNTTVTLADDRMTGDSLSASYTSASFANKNVGAAKTVSVSGITISGTDAANYTANTTATTTADITARALVVSATGVNKVYDGSISATVTLSDNRVAGDSLSTSYTNASFASKTVGTAKSVSIGGISVSGADVGNYTFNTTTSTTANITAKALTVSGVTANNKVYDGTTTATLDTQLAALNGVLSGDVVTLSAAGSTGAFANKNVGTGKTVTASGLSLSGADAANYSLTQPTTTADISKAPLNVKADDKTRAAGAANPTLTATYSGFVGGETLATSGVTGGPALSTTTTNVAGTYPITSAIGTLSAANYSFNLQPGQLTVTAAAANKLVVQTQPSSTANAGVAFAQQPQIQVQDQYGNFLSSDNGRVITVARSAGTGTLQGTLTATTVNGIATFANLSHNVANTITLSFTASGLTSATSSNIIVSAGAFTKLQLLVPGETAAPGTASGKTGTPSAQTASTAFTVTVNAVDDNWNLMNTISDVVGLTSSDSTATLPYATLVAGTTTKTVFLNASGSFTITASDLSTLNIQPSTSPVITVSPAQFTPATGGEAIPADGATGIFTTLTGPTYSENNAGEVRTGTIILKAPAGFVFATSGTLPTVSSVKISGSGSSPVQGSVTSVTTNQITYTVTAISGNPTKLTWQNVRVRPTSGTSLASGYISRSGTATVTGLSTNANLGGLREVAGAASNLVILTQPSATATAGVPFDQQPILEVRDQFGSLRSAANGISSGTVVTAARLAGSGTLQGTTSMTTGTDGVVTFTNLAHNVATNITIQFSSPGATSSTSTSIAVSGGAASSLVFTTQPGNGIVGSVLATQPVVRSRDQFGNDSTAGLGASYTVTVALSAGTGPLLGTTTFDIGTGVGNGVAAFTDLGVGSAGTDKQLTASASGLSAGVSSVFSVIRKDQSIAFGALASKTYGDAPFTVGATASSGLPVSFSIVSGPATIAGNTISLTGVGTVTVRASQSGDADWNAAASVDQSFSVAQKVVTGGITATSKTYDGTTAAAIATRTLSGVVGSDAVSLTGGTAAFADKNLGSGKTVTATGLSLTGTAAGKYQLASTTATTAADITARTLVVSATAVNKVYDGSASATVTLSDNRVAGDTLVTSQTAANFADKNVGTAKTVSVSGIAVTGADAANYTANTTATTTANITAKGLTVSGVTASNKVYDGTTTATLNTQLSTLNGLASGDVVTLNSSGAAGSFASKTVGTAKPVTITGLTLGGIDAANYTLPQPSTTANITTRTLSVTATAVNKVYDATTSATVTLSDDRVSGDTLTRSYTTASFADKNVGTAKTVNVTGITFTGTDVGNYTFSTTASTTANITARTLTVSAAATSKVYDGSASATVTLSDNRLAGDSLATSQTAANFADKNVGTAKTVSISGITLTGADAANYTANTTATASANITAKGLTVSGVTASNKVYDGTTTATLNTQLSTLNGLASGDDVTLNSSGAAASFASKTVGTAKPVTITGLTLGGIDAANYTLPQPSTTANITTRILSVTATAVSKAYDATTSATVTLSDDRVSGDTLTRSYTAASFADKNVGTAKTVNVTGITVTGTDASNYTFNTSASTTADITARSLTVSAAATNKVYDGSASATVTLSDNRVSGDALATSHSSASFADKNVGTAKTVSVSGIAVTGTDAANYTANTTATATANITAKGLTVSGVTANNKVYDGTTTATLDTQGVSFSGVLSGDVVTLSAAGSTGAFANKNVGTAKTVTISGLSLSGADAANYTVTQPTATADITKAALTVKADDKTRAAGASNPTLTATYSGYVGGETLATSGVTGSPALSTTTTNVAGTYPITAAIGSLTSANYSFNLQGGQLTVTAAAANKLVIQTQPSSTASAGVAFAQQPQIQVQDQYGNFLSSDNGRVITVARSAGTGTLQGTLTATTVNGIASFANLSHNVATTITLNFTASGLTSATSGNIVISPGAVTQLAFTTQPAGLRTGSPLATQPVVKAADQFGNASSVGLPANFNIALSLTSGSGSLLGTTSLDIGAAAGNGTATFTTVECSDAGASKQITASAAGFTNAISSLFDLDGVERATGGQAIPSSTAGGTYTTLTGPVYYEYVMGDVGTGTIILNAPAGFVFDTGGTAPTVKVTRLSGGGNDGKNINGVASGTSVAVTSRTMTQITFTVSVASSGDVACSLTWQNVRVRPSAASPLASGNITKTGTSVMPAVNNSSTSFGRLIETGPAARLVLQTQPSSAATAGVAFAQQPVIRVEDAAGNLLTANNTTVVTATRSSGSGTLQGTTSRTAVNGLLTFTDLAHNVAGNITISFSSTGLTGTNSAAIAVSPAAASQLVFTAQPANGTVGALLATQPVLRSRDQFGNDSTIGLGANMSVTVSLSAGTGPLLGTPTLDIGTSAGNGLISFNDLRIDSAGSNKQLTASASGMSSATSSVFTVAKANQTISFGALSARTYGDAPFTIGATASSGLPVSFGIVSGPATISGNSVTITGAGTVTVRASQSGDVNWNAATSVDQSFAVAKKTVTGSITANSKTYDGTTAAAIATRALSGVVGSDNVSLSGGTATFANKNVGGSKTVTATGLSLSGTAAGNYQLASTSATTTADISATGLTVSGVTASNKVYDGTTTATLNLGSAALVGVVSGDAVTLNTSSAAGAFADENVGTAKPVTVSGLSLSGADAINYTLTQPSTTASITTQGLMVTGITAASKVYDGTTAATLNLSGATLVGVASGDTITLDTTSATATFADANVGTAKAVTVSGLSLSGADAVNYALVQPSATADITVATVTGSITADNKIYDGTTAATLATRNLSGVVGNNNVRLSGGTASFADKNVGSGKSVTATGLSLSGADAANYQLASTSADTTADITAATLTASITAENKNYDGTTTATIATRTLGGVVGSEDVSLIGGTANFADKNLGTGKSVTATGLSLSGADMGNYELSSTSASTTADITAATLTGSITAENKNYDGTTTATIATRTLSGVVGSEDVSLTGGTANFADQNVGIGKTVTATSLSLSGTAAGNYQLASTSVATTADITAATLIGNITASNKTYDGTTTATIATRTLSGVVGGDAVSLVGGTATFSDKNVGIGKSVTDTGLSLSGDEAGNYQLASTSAATTGDITVRTLTVSASGANKVYDGTTAATVTLSDDRVSGDVLSTSYATASFADKNVGSGKTVSVSGISVAGADAANYTVNTTAASTADITARTLTVTAVGVNKVYDGTTTATVTLMDDRIDGDDLTVSYTTASFADKDVQNGKLVSVSGISVSGTAAGNYTADTEASTVADITGATLTVVGITAQNKVYDGTTVATLNLDGAVVIGLVSGDDVTVVVGGVAGAFSDAEVGTGKLVTVSGLTLIGADAGKYTLTQPTTTADITAAQ